MESIFLPSKMFLTPGVQENESILTIEPLHHGYGTSVGNALRRVLLSSLPGSAVTAMKIRGVQHEFAGLTGVKEDILDIGLNLKLLRLKVHSDEPVVLTLKAKGNSVITAGDIEKNADVEIVNPDLVIATLTSKTAVLDMEITVEKGRGYSTTETRNEHKQEIGLIYLDALFSPVKTVGLKVENTRVGEVTNYDKLIMNIITDGTITAQEATEQATKIILNHFSWIQGQLQHASLTEQIARSSEDHKSAGE